MSALAAIWPSHRAIVAAWAADATVLALLGDPPEIHSGAAPAGRDPLPRVVVGYTAGRRLETLDAAPPASPSVDFHAWTAGAGYDRILPLMAALCDALTDARLATLPDAAGFRGVNVRAEILGTLIDPDRTTMHGIGRITYDLIDA